MPIHRPTTTPAAIKVTMVETIVTIFPLQRCFLQLVPRHSDFARLSEGGTNLLIARHISRRTRSNLCKDRFQRVEITVQRYWFVLNVYRCPFGLLEKNAVFPDRACIFARACGNAHLCTLTAQKRMQPRLDLRTFEKRRDSLKFDRRKLLTTRRCCRSDDA
jgi:hypothetical protein